MITEVTLQDLLDKQAYLESTVKEPKEFVSHLLKSCRVIAKTVSSQQPIKIITDYDADGICSSYIMRQLVKNLDPNADVTIICNDRRNGYGVPKDLEREENCKYIICDMGSNELDYILQKFGSDTIIFDHHIIENEDDVYAFKNSQYLLNPKCFEQDGKSADYCTTGLAFRAYRCFEKIPNISFKHDAVVDNTVSAMACIGTIADSVNVMDTLSFNRQIIRHGLEAINNANRDNFNFIFGNFLSSCGLNTIDIRASDISFKVVPVINAVSRTSEETQKNGSQMLINAFVNADAVESSWEIKESIELNNLRKQRVAELQNAPEFQQVVQDEKDSDSRILLYKMKDDTPTAYAGLVASKLADETNKAVLAVSYNTRLNCYTGSGRNVSSNKTSLKEFIDKISEGIDGFEYGGHSNAIGISHLTPNAYDKLFEAIGLHGKEMEMNEDRTVLKMSNDEFLSKTTLDMLKQLEPTGQGWTLPPVELKCKEVFRDKLYIKKNPKWKTVKLDLDGKKNYIKVTDWNYSAENYPQFSDGKTVKVLANVSVNSYNAKDGVVEEIQLTAKHDLGFQKQYLKEIQAEKQELAQSK